MASPSPLPTTPYKIHHCHSPQLGPIGLCITPPFLYIHQYAAPEGLRLAAIPWVQVRKLAKVTANKFASIPTLVIWFYRGRLPETMVRLMVDDHRLVVTFLGSGGGSGPGRSIETLLQEMIHTGGLVKIRRFWNVHYEPAKVTRGGPSVNAGINRNHRNLDYQINEEDFDNE